MITETIFIIILVAMLVFLILTMQFQNEAFGAFTIILCLMLALVVFPGIGGVSYQTGSLINDSGGGNIQVTNVYSVYENIYLGMTFILIIFYLSMNIITFRKNKKREEEEDVS